jgi:hypothetical protein
MNCTLGPLLRKYVLVFFDDILIYNQLYEEHLQHLEQVFQLLQKEQWRIKQSKCSFVKREISYMGYTISAARVATNPDKVKVVAEWPIPSNVKEVRSFLGLVGYYRKFVKHFGIIAKPLTELLKKHVLFVRISEHDTAFQTLKSTLVVAPVLALPDFSKPFCIETGASESGVGVVLMQDHHTVAFVSKPLDPKLRGLSIYEKEYVAILLVVDQWRYYLQLGEFIISTDWKSLSHLNEHRLHTSWQQKVFTKLMGLNYKIIYKKGVENKVADALSRRPNGDFNLALCMAISSLQPKWLDEIANGYTQEESTT